MNNLKMDLFLAAQPKKTPVLRSTAVRKSASCRRCGGLGIIPAFRHIEKGRCFACTNAPQMRGGA